MIPIRWQRSSNERVNSSRSSITSSYDRSIVDASSDRPAGVVDRVSLASTIVVSKVGRMESEPSLSLRALSDGDALHGFVLIVDSSWSRDAAGD